VYNEDYSFILNRYQFESVDFLYQFGEKDFNEKLTWKKDFMDRLFAVNNLDELESKQDFVKNYQTFLRF
jgi:hypothetical protein